MANTRKDILLDDNLNLQWANGDMVIGESDQQHVHLLLISNKGDFRESPTVGCGLIHWLKKPHSSVKSMQREITVQLKNDGYKAGFEIDENGEFNVTYKNNY